MIDEVQPFCGGGLPFPTCFRGQARVGSGLARQKM